MNEVFENIIEKLEESSFLRPNSKEFYNNPQNGEYVDNVVLFRDAIEIVKQEAEQYQSSEIGFISKTEVLTLIEEIKCNNDIPKNYGTLLDIMRMIRNMPTVDNTDNGWIACSERLPEESGTYIVNAIENSIIHVTFAKWMPRMKKWDLTGCRSYWKVNAWQPLPEPFKERD